MPIRTQTNRKVVGKKEGQYFWGLIFDFSVLEVHAVVLTGRSANE